MEVRRLAVVGTGLIGASVALAAKRAGLKSGIYCATVEYAKRMAAKGFDLVTVVNDQTLIGAGARLVKEFR